jgi:hypothetical protein
MEFIARETSPGIAARSQDGVHITQGVMYYKAKEIPFLELTQKNSLRFDLNSTAEVAKTSSKIRAFADRMYTGKLTHVCEGTSLFIALATKTQALLPKEAHKSHVLTIDAAGSKLPRAVNVTDLTPGTRTVKTAKHVKYPLLLMAVGERWSTKTDDPRAVSKLYATLAKQEGQLFVLDYFLSDKTYTVHIWRTA